MAIVLFLYTMSIWIISQLRTQNILLMIQQGQFDTYRPKHQPFPAHAETFLLRVLQLATAREDCGEFSDTTGAVAIELVDGVVHVRQLATGRVLN